MIIYLVRHASAGEHLANPKKDEKRPLDADGIEQCGYMGRALAALNAQPDVVISSPLKRATQTASLIANEIGFEGKLQLEAAMRPEASFPEFRRMLEKYAKHEAIMVVGHNPNFSDFLGRTIAGSGERAHVDLRKGSVAKIESKQKKYVLDWLLTPRLAKAAADANVGESASSSVQNGNGEFEIPDEYLSLRARSLPSDDQEAGRTTKSRPKTSRK